MIEKDDILDTKFSIHDKYRFEAKLELPNSKEKKPSYIIEYFFFLPSSLNISSETFKKENFYSDTQHYIRFKIPKIDNLFSPENIYSPYNKAIKALENLSFDLNNEFLIETIVDEIKMLGSVLRINIKDSVYEIINNNIKDKILENKCLKINQEINVIVKEINNIKTIIFSSKFNNRIRNSFFVFDEYLSLTIGEYLIDLVGYIEKSEITIKEEIINDLKNLIISQKKYRETMNYKAFIKEGRDFTHFLYHRSFLKKFISSAFFLKLKLSDFNIINHTGPAIAAGIAMLFALIVTIYAQNKYALNSAHFVIIIIISYIFKDRIKEWFKIIFAKKMINWIYDRKILVLTPVHDRKIGEIKETFSYLNPSLLPLKIKEYRDLDNQKNIEDDAKEEIIFKYKRQISLDFEKIEKYHNRRKSLIDIIRFSIEDFIKHTDDDIINYEIIDEKTKEIKNIYLPRVYHINLIVRYKISNIDFNYERVRLIFSKKGLVSVEEIL